MTLWFTCDSLGLLGTPEDILGARGVLWGLLGTFMGLLGSRWNSWGLLGTPRES